MNAQAQNADILPMDLKQQTEKEQQTEKAPVVLVPNTVHDVLVGHTPLALVMLGQINFYAGLEMMKRLKWDAKKRKGTTDQDLHPDSTVEDALASMMAEDPTPMELSKATGLVAATVVLSRRMEIGDDNYLKFIRDNILSPMKFIERQDDRAADFQTEQRLMQAQRFGLTLESDKIKNQLKGQRAEHANNFKAEVASAADIPGIMNMETEALVEFIADAYDFRKDWHDELIGRVVKMYENNVDKLKKGWLVDMDDTLIQIAREHLK